MRQTALTIRIALLFLTVVLGSTRSAQAVDGIILIDQAKAMAGSVTPGDAPGFPVSITRPGSYRLSTNLVVPDEHTHAILVTVASFFNGANVTIDLNGFAILGPNVCGTFTIGGPMTCTKPGSGDGVRGLATYGLVVMNGTIRGMGANGINIQNSYDISSRIERLTVTNCGGAGILVDRGLVINNSVGSNYEAGIVVTAGLVQSNVLLGNRGFGLWGGNQVGYTQNVLSIGGLFMGAVLVGGNPRSLGQNLCELNVC